MTEVFIVTKNADFTEGRGPMLFDRVFDTFEAAEFYVLNQGGIFGSQQRRSDYQYLREPTNVVGYNGYEIRTAVLETFSSYEEERKLKDEIDKLKKKVETLEQVKNAKSKYFSDNFNF